MCDKIQPDILKPKNMKKVNLRREVFASTNRGIFFSRLESGIKLAGFVIITSYLIMKFVFIEDGPDQEKIEFVMTRMIIFCGVFAGLMGYGHYSNSSVLYRFFPFHQEHLDAYKAMKKKELEDKKTANTNRIPRIEKERDEQVTSYNNKIKNIGIANEKLDTEILEIEKLTLQ